MNHCGVCVYKRCALCTVRVRVRVPLCVGAIVCKSEWVSGVGRESLWCVCINAVCCLL